MRNWTLLFLAVLLALMPAATAIAQNDIEFSNLQIDLWPEYDQPKVLVIYKITLASTTSLPAKLDLRIPAEAGEPNAVAVVPPDGVPVNLEYELSSDGEWITISLVANLYELQIEYYDPRLEKDGSQRNFTYQWSGDYAVQRCRLQVLQPFDASILSVSPGPTTTQTLGGQDFVVKDVGSLLANQTFEVELSYQKESDVLGISRMPVESSNPLTSETGWQSKMLGYLPWVLGIGGVLLIVGGAVWYWQSGRQTQSSGRKRRRARKPASSQPDEAHGGEGVYCHQCGKRAASGDRFCRSCGTRLRVE